jgi:hypothetical protein
MPQKSKERSIKNESPKEQRARLFMERRLKESDKRAREFAQSLDPRQFTDEQPDTESNEE